MGHRIEAMVPEPQAPSGASLKILFNLALPSSSTQKREEVVELRTAPVQKE